jgi:translation initiation factor 2B subunit (eIF-2B alpha/beta/delta family)
MEAQGSFERELEAVLADREHGASEIERRLVAVLASALEEGGLTPERLETATALLLRYQPTMANLLGLFDELWRVEESGLPPDERAGRLAERLRERAERLAGEARLGPLLARALAGRDVVLTLSRSGSVLAALAGAARSGARLRVIVGEGRPGGEGRGAAADLATGGLEAWCAVDAALPALLHDPGSLPLPFPLSRERTAVVLGADAIGPAWFLNKVGSYALALAAREAEVPVVLVATESKRLPPALLARLEIRPAESLGLAPGVGAIDFLFERVPLALVTRAVLETGLAAPAELARRAAALPASRRLAVPEVAAAPADRGGE